MNKRKTLNIHHDYELFNMYDMLKTTAHLVMTHVMNRMSYSENFENCYKFYTSKLMKTLHEFERILEKCLESKEYRKDGE